MSLHIHIHLCVKRALQDESKLYNYIYRITFRSDVHDIQHHTQSGEECANKPRKFQSPKKEKKKRKKEERKKMEQENKLSLFLKSAHNNAAKCICCFIVIKILGAARV